MRDQLFMLHAGFGAAPYPSLAAVLRGNVRQVAP
jgi:hypothetical protein